jgi:hypothetical protein
VAQELEGGILLRGRMGAVAKGQNGGGASWDMVSPFHVIVYYNVFVL